MSTRWLFFPSPSASETVLDTYTLGGGTWRWRSANNWWNGISAGSWSSTGTTTGTYLKVDTGSRIDRNQIIFSASDPGSWPSGAKVRLTVTPSSGGVKSTKEASPTGAGDSVWTWVAADGSDTAFTTAEIEEGGTFGWNQTDSITLEIFTT
tara:strand:+ start:93 stop:545 length:453 start_codon:yes stop_codon:yes gene_type:complete